MVERKNIIFKTSISFMQIFLIVGFVFAVAFVFSENVSAFTLTPTQYTNIMESSDRGETPLDNFVNSEIAGTPAPTNSEVKNELGGGDSTIGKEFSLFGLKFEGSTAYLAEGLVWAGAAYTIGKLGGSFLGLNKDQSNTLGFSLASGAIAYKGIQYLGETGKLGSENFLVKNAGLVGVGVAAAVFVLLYKKESQQLVTFECNPWEPPLGGSSCEECNKDPFRPCSEYRCKSLGQACELLNPGTEEEKCTWVAPGDVTSPTIQAWTEALKPLNVLSYNPDNTIRPPNRGVKIQDNRNTNGCLEPFSPLEFGIELNEPARCKLDWNRNNSFDSMGFYFGESNLFAYNHTQKMRLPTPDPVALGEDSPLLQNNGEFGLFVRCQDANGNVNEDAFVFSFCVDPSPDTTPPLIEDTSIQNNGAVQYNADSVPIEVYVNEPSECKWSRQDKEYNDMENTMTCDTNPSQVNADLLYTCSGQLTGIENQKSNDFYFRCKDQPGAEESDRNVNVQSYKLTLRGSQELNILSVSPEDETISGSTDTVPVSLVLETDDGADEGRAICYFSNTGEQGTYVQMFETESFEHRQTLDLTGGDYEMFFRCVDSGGNSAEISTEFTVFVDKQAPKVTRAYKDLDALKIVTDEDAECAYSLTSCNYVFEEGEPLIYSNIDDKENHYAKWDLKNNYYIKCRDEKGNEPGPNSCSIVVKGVNLI